LNFEDTLLISKVSELSPVLVYFTSYFPFSIFFAFKEYDNSYLTLFNLALKFVNSLKADLIRYPLP
jgi:hypothetical protein